MGVKSLFRRKGPGDPQGEDAVLRLGAQAVESDVVAERVGDVDLVQADAAAAEFAGRHGFGAFAEQYGDPSAGPDRGREGGRAEDGCVQEAVHAAGGRPQDVVGDGSAAG